MERTTRRDRLRSARRIMIGVTVGTVVLVLALGVALRRPSFGRAPVPADFAQASPERLEQTVRWLTMEVVPRTSDHPENLRRAAEYLAEAFRSAGAVVVEDHYPVRGNEFAIVRARLGPGASHPGTVPRLVVGAHYDAFDPGRGVVNPGADDNASGVAGLVELVRILGVGELRRPLSELIEVVAFPNEEPPHFAQATMGSAVYVRQLSQRIRRSPGSFRGMVNLEMIGYTSRRQPWPNLLFRLLYPRHGHFTAIVGRHADRHLVRDFKLGLRASGTWPHALVLPFAVAGFDASDHRSFWQAGLPAIVISDTAFVRNPHYHTDRDSHARLDYEFMADVVDGVALAIWSSEAARPHSTPKRSRLLRY